MRRLVPLLSLLLMGMTKPACADPAPPKAAAADTTMETSVLTGVGVLSGERMAGVAASLLATHRFGWIELGLEGQAAGLIAGLLGVGGVAGVHLGDALSVRLLGSAGVHAYGGVGRRLLSDDPGVSGSTRYVGGRLLLGHSLAKGSRGGHRGFLGLLGAIDGDLSRSTKVVTYMDTSWLDGDPQEVTTSHTLGQTSFAAYVVAGFELDLASDW